VGPFLSRGVVVQRCWEERALPELFLETSVFKL
jgi:hypothetical protein